MTQLVSDVFSPLDGPAPDRTPDLVSWLRKCDQLSRQGGADREKARVCRRLLEELQRANAQRLPLLNRYRQHLSMNYREVAAGLSHSQKRDYFLSTDHQAWARVVTEMRPPAERELRSLAAIEGPAAPAK